MSRAGNAFTPKYCTILKYSKRAAKAKATLLMFLDFGYLRNYLKAKETG